jgi:hypothetical protein
MRKNQSQHHRLLAYMMGWRCGAAGGAMSGLLEEDPDFKIGFQVGRGEKEKIYARACIYYGTTLTVLRAQKEAGK